MGYLNLKHSTSQKVSPQQMQTVKLLHLSEEDIPDRIDKEIEINPALEKDEEIDSANNIKESSDSEFSSEFDRYNYKQSNYLRERQDWYNDARENIPKKEGLYDKLIEQLNFLSLPEKEYKIALYLIASLENDGYLRRDLKLLVNELAFSEYVFSSEEDLESILAIIQQFDPPGVAARTLQECLLLQSNRLNLTTNVGHIINEIIKKHFDLLVKNKVSKAESLIKNINKADFNHALKIIGSLNTKPYIDFSQNYNSKDFYPDFIVTLHDGALKVSFYKDRSVPLRINRSYVSLLDRYKSNKKSNTNLKEAAAFVKQNLEKANWFISALKQRKITLLSIMNAIVDEQQKFFITGNISDIKPLIMKDIAFNAKMDTSTVSRVVSNKYVKTDSGVYSLKYFFSTGISTTDGYEVSNKEVHFAIKQIVDAEDKLNPYSDEAISALLKERGYNIARRTVAKYRDTLSIRPSRDRKEDNKLLTVPQC